MSQDNLYLTTKYKPVPVIRVGDRCFELVRPATSSESGQAIQEGYSTSSLTQDDSVDELFDDCLSCVDCKRIGCAGQYRTELLASDFLLGVTEEEASSSMLVELSSLYERISDPGYVEHRDPPYNDMNEGPCSGRVVECGYEFSWIYNDTGFFEHTGELFGCYSCAEASSSSGAFCSTLCVRGSIWDSGDVNGTYEYRYDDVYETYLWLRVTGGYLLWYDDADMRWEIVGTTSGELIYYSNSPKSGCPPEDFAEWVFHDAVGVSLATPAVLQGSCYHAPSICVFGNLWDSGDVNGAYSWGYNEDISVYGWTRGDSLYIIWWNLSANRWELSNNTGSVVYYSDTLPGDSDSPPSRSEDWVLAPGAPGLSTASPQITTGTCPACPTVCVRGSVWDSGDVNGTYEYGYNEEYALYVWERTSGGYILFYDPDPMRWELVDAVSGDIIYYSEAEPGCPPEDFAEWIFYEAAGVSLATPAVLSGECYHVPTICVSDCIWTSGDINGEYTWGYNEDRSRYEWTRGDGLYSVWWNATSVQWEIWSDTSVVIYYSDTIPGDADAPPPSPADWVLGPLAPGVSTASPMITAGGCGGCSTVCVRGSVWDSGDVNGTYEYGYNSEYRLYVWSRATGGYLLFYDPDPMRWELVDDVTGDVIFYSDAASGCPPESPEDWSLHETAGEALAMPSVTAGGCTYAPVICLSGNVWDSGNVDGEYTWGEHEEFGIFGWIRGDELYTVWWNTSTVRWEILDALGLVVYYSPTLPGDDESPPSSEAAWLFDPEATGVSTISPSITVGGC